MTWIEEHCLKRYYEMAESDREIRLRLSVLSEMVIQHLFKIYYMPDSESRNHWISEIFGFLNVVNKRKANHKLPDREFIYNTTFGNCEDAFVEHSRARMDDIEYYYKVKTNPADVDDLCKICKEYFEWLSDKLAENGEVSCREVFEEINKIFEK